MNRKHKVYYVISVVPELLARRQLQYTKPEKKKKLSELRVAGARFGAESLVFFFSFFFSGQRAEVVSSAGPPPLPPSHSGGDPQREEGRPACTLILTFAL